MKLPRRSDVRCVPVALAALVLALGTSFVAALPASADDAPQSDPGVARLSNLGGDVDVRRGDSNDTFAAALNAPIGVGDYLTTRHGSRAEVEFNYASLLRVAGDSQLRFVKLDPHAHELQLAEGTVELRVLRGLEAHPIVDTPAVTVTPVERGQYRVTVTHDGNTEVTVRSGRADVVVGDNVARRTLEPGSTFLVTGDGQDLRSRTIDTVAFDDFDQWTDGLDGRFANDVANAYDDRGIVGADDLGDYGQWVDSADYGQVWQPTEPAGWSPYSDGRWVWEPYYGWTWVGNEPWGFAPYHYGRWFYANDAWAWYPGADAVDEAYAYAPALVGFFGFGGGDGIGWTPLAPFEAYHPWWGNGGNGFANTSGMNNHEEGNGGAPYRNTMAPGGAMGVSGTNFAGGHFDNIKPLSPPSLHDLTALRGLLPVVPTLANLAFGGGSPRASDGVVPRSPGFDRLSPVAVRQASFEDQRAAIATAVDRLPQRVTHLDEPERGDTPSYARPDAPSEHPENGGGAGSPWTRFDRFTTSQAPQANDAWSRFGSTSPERTEPEARVRSDVPSYATHPYATPERAAYDSAHDRAEPARDSYREPSRSYSESPRSYSESPRSYSASPRSYSESPRSYSESPRSYSESPRSYAGPQHSESRATSHGSSGASNHGSSKHDRKDR